MWLYIVQCLTTNTIVSFIFNSVSGTNKKKVSNHIGGYIQYFYSIWYSCTEVFQ